jgi:hypothetical protein
LTDLPSTISTACIIAAVVVFQFKHLLADFILQTTWMAQGKEKPRGWLLPLATHAGVHGFLTAAIFAVAAPSYLWLGLADFVVHFAIDRAKGMLSREFDADTTKTAFWWLIGIDQTLHHLTHLIFAVVIAVAHSLP